MKYSVIVPVYNVENYLAKCLDSLVCQRSDSFEIIVVDDGSTDLSGRICDQYAVKYPDKVVVIHQENKGLGGARNTGIDAAKGEYLLFVDSDDTVSADTLTVLEAAVTKHSPEIVIFAMQNVDESMKTLGVVAERLDKDELFAFEERKDSLTIMPNACNKLFKAELFKKSGVRFPDRVWYEDLRTVPKLVAMAQRIVYIDNVLYNYLVRAGSITQNKNIARNREIMWALDDLREYFTQNGLMEKCRDELEKLAIDHVFIAASVRVIRADRKSELIKAFRAYMDENFPDYSKNPYIKTLPKMKMLAYKLVRAKMYFLIDILFKIKR